MWFGPGPATPFMFINGCLCSFRDICGVGDTRVFAWFLPELFDVAVEQMVVYLPRVSVWTGVCSRRRVRLQSSRVSTREGKPHG